MASSRDRNRKLAARAARRKAVVAVKRQAERLAASPAGKVAAAAKGPVERCLHLPDLFTVGIGHVVLARRLPSGALGCVFFLVDIYCMGVKEAFYREMAPSEFEETIEALRGGGRALVDMDPAAAKKLVTEAVAYAAEAGIPPAKDYRIASRIFGDIDASASTESFTFGVNGKPLYIPGPNDSPMRVRAITATLNRSRGAGGWDATLVIGDDIVDVESPLLDAEGFPIDDDDPEDEDDALTIENQREEPEQSDEDVARRRS